MEAMPAAATEKPEAHTKVAVEQRLRKRRLAMSFASYMVTFTLVTFCWSQGMVPFMVVARYLAFVLAINLCFLAAFQTNFNLRFRDPSLTAAQMVISLAPALYVMYFLDAGQARAVFLLIIIVPALYGILALNTRQFLVTSLFFVLLYLGLVAVLYWQRPQVLNGPLELIQFLALLLVMGEIAIIGGFIHGLREKLRKRNGELRDTMQDLNNALGRIRELASRDDLTGVFNRRYLFDVLAKETNRCHRANGPFSVCILDIDFFKQVNDRFGHQAGDEVLRRVADSVSSRLRNIDCFGRYGGEEFLLILPQTPMEGAAIKAERVRRQIEELRFSDIAPDVRVTVSIGVAEFLSDENVDATIQRADAALYQAKEQGRNRVVLGREERG